MGPSGGGSSKAGLVYMGALTQDGDTGDMNKSITCKGYSSYLVIAGVKESNPSVVTITSTDGTVAQAMQDEVTVYSSYLKKNTTNKPDATIWSITGCSRSETTITIKRQGYFFLAYFIYGID